MSNKTDVSNISKPGIRVLNMSTNKEFTKKTALVASRDLQKLMLRMKGGIMSEDGTGINYAELKASKLYEEYKDHAAALSSVDLGVMTETERKAFFINIYNALTIHGLGSFEELPSSVINVQLFWKLTAYNIGGLIYSLDDIEHGVLRGNSPHPTTPDIPFAPNDPRLKYVCKADPRIHFAVNCGAKSCPAIRVYSAENLETGLEGATRSFCQQEVKVYRSCRQIHVSRLFQWYKGDFGQTDVDAIRWTTKYLEPNVAEELTDLLYILEQQGQVSIEYRDYDWGINTPQLKPRTGLV